MHIAIEIDDYEDTTEATACNKTLITTPLLGIKSFFSGFL